MQIEQPSEGKYEIDVIWYYAPEGAKRFRGINAFTSGIWDRDTPAQSPLLGEQQPYASPYYGGKNVWGYIGQCFVGTPENFASGLTARELLKPQIAIPSCCIPHRSGVGVLVMPTIPPLTSVSTGVGELLGAGGTMRDHVQVGAGEVLGTGLPPIAPVTIGAGEVLEDGVTMDDVVQVGAGEVLGTGLPPIAPVTIGAGEVLGTGGSPDLFRTGLVLGLRVETQLFPDSSRVGELLGAGLVYAGPNPIYPGAGELLGAGTVQLDQISIGAGELLGAGTVQLTDDLGGAGELLSAGQVSEYQGTGEVLGAGVTMQRVDQVGAGVKVGAWVPQEDHTGVLLSAGQVQTYFSGCILGVTVDYTVF